MDPQSILACAYFFVGSILAGAGAIVVGATILTLNNMFNKYWKPIKWNYYVPVEYRDTDTK